MTQRLEPALRRYFETIVHGEPDAEAKVRWRISCYEQGANIAALLAQRGKALEGATVIDVACAWGGHALALAERGAKVLACDLLNHRFDALNDFARSENLDLHACVASCFDVPAADASSDVVLALELIEHIPDLASFAQEVNRVLRPGGVCVLSTPPRWRSFFWGEPHYNLKYLTLLPFRLQRPVAEKLLKRAYPYPITRQFSSAKEIDAVFAPLGFETKVVLEGRLRTLAEKHPQLARFLEARFFAMLILEKRV